MTRNSPRRKVGADFWSGRIKQGRDFLEAARQALELAEPGQNANPIVSQIVLSAIAYADCLTARRAGVVNTQDHAAAPKLLRDVLREQLPDAQERRFRRILAKKDESQYGAKPELLSHANTLFADLEDFAQWVEDVVGAAPRE
jgi:hypothetical protein